MTATGALTGAETRGWGLAAVVALAAHAGALALLLAWVRPAEPPVPEPVVLVEMPPLAEAAAQPVDQAAALPQPADPAPPVVPVPRLDVPPAPVPVTRDAVVVQSNPQPAREPAPSAPPAPVAVAAPREVAQPAAASGPADPRARRQEADYFAMVSAHLNRRKVYPAEARQARQQGVVTVRFTVDRSGAVSGVSVKRSSGHAVLDNATLDLLQRVAPLPRMPATMARESVTLSLPIEYSLRTS